MKTYKHFTPYIPKDEEREELSSMGYEFLHDKDNNDWYEIQGTFSPETLKLAYADDGTIDSVSFDVTALVPRNLSVSEVAEESIPEGFFDSGKWVFNGSEIIPYEYTQDELIALAEVEKSKLMEAANAAIAPLQDAVDLDIATDAESALLLEWKKYRVLLSRVNPSLAPDISWPPLPTSVATIGKLDLEAND